MRGRLKELWKPILQITHGLSIYETLANFVEEQRNVRLAAKQNTLEGHIVKVVTELHNQAKDNPANIPFQTIWFALAEDIDGKMDDKKPHVMDTSEFFRISKHKIGYRLREVLSGKSKTVREKDVTVKAYEFNHEKLRRIAKKYGYELVTKLPLLPSSEGAQTPNSTSRNIRNNVEKSLDAPVENGNISNSVTKPKSIDEMFSSQKGLNATLRDLEDVLRRNWQKGTTEDLYALIHEKSKLDKTETAEYVAKLIEEGKIGYDPDGWLKWLK